MIASSRSSFLQHGVHNGVVIYARCTGLLCWSCVAVRCSVLVVLCCLFASDASQLHDLASSDRQKLCKDDVHNAMRALRRPCAAVGCCSPSGCTLLLSAPAWHRCSVLCTSHGSHLLASRIRSSAPSRQSPPPALLHRLAAPCRMTGNHVLVLGRSRAVLCVQNPAQKAKP